MLSVRLLCLERYFQPVFQPLDFDLSAGELIVVTGSNGSGKTTLIRLLAGLIDPTSGTISCESRFLQYVGHDPAVKAELSVRENLQFCANLSAPDTPLQGIIEEMGLEHCAEQAGRTLSAGQRKRTALARLMVTGADLWLLDEPYTNLDNKGVDLVDRMLDRHLSRGGSCVLATHGNHRPRPADPASSGWRITEIALDPVARAA